ncbi:hypothetical protein [Bacillus sp. FJAT-22090]|uniref:hypothetical protein n=1 Tax=Bacillus sp. FJAT-22090 TaxID=1581038 RepID=UPI0011A4368D|nr:hypothetical protein [Bacillus sp. FJAT-22090]
MSLIIEYWQVIVAVLALVSLLGTGIFYFVKKPSKKQIEQIKQWLIYACLEAEKTLGEKTGQLKLRLVYDAFLTKFRWIAYFMSFETFSKLVDEALIEVRKMLETNKAIVETVNKTRVSIEGRVNIG